MIFLLSFIQDWWIKIQKFIHEIDLTTKIIVSGALFLISLYAIFKFIKPVGKKRIKFFPIILFVLSFSIAIILLTV